eukprot:scaffold35915_cov69-Phaeocystis_antarctica.AAC.12
MCGPAARSRAASLWPPAVPPASAPCAAGCCRPRPPHTAPAPPRPPAPRRAAVRASPPPAPPPAAPRAAPLPARPGAPRSAPAPFAAHRARARAGRPRCTAPLDLPLVTTRQLEVQAGAVRAELEILLADRGVRLDEADRVLLRAALKSPPRGGCAPGRLQCLLRALELAL